MKLSDIFHQVSSIAAIIGSVAVAGAQVAGTVPTGTPTVQVAFLVISGILGILGFGAGATEPKKV